MKTTTTFLKLLLLFFVATATTALGQKKTDPAIEAIDNEIFAEFKKIETTLKNDTKLYERLTKEIGAANAITDSVARKEAINKYLQANDVAYGELVKKAGVDYKLLINSLSRKYTAYKFTLVNKYGIVYERESSNYRAQSYSAPISYTAQDITGFSHKEEEDSDCSAHVKFPYNRSVHVNTTALSITNRCEATGQLIKSAELSTTNRPVALNFTYRIDMNGEALGVFGTAGSSSYISVLIQGMAEMYDEDYYKSAVAPIAMYSSYDKDKVYPRQFSLYQRNDNTDSLYFWIYSTSSSGSLLCCGTRARSNVAISKCELIIAH